MEVKKLHPEAIIPTKKVGDAGFDIAVLLENAVNPFYTLCPNETKLFHTGLAIWLEDPSLVGFVMPRSKLATKHGIVIGNLTGVLDGTYQGELMVSLWNRSEQPFIIESGMTVAQLVITKIPVCTKFEIVDDFVSVTERGSKGVNCKELRV